MTSKEYKLYVGGNLIQFSRELSGITILKDPLIRKLCPYSLWELRVNDMVLDISQYEPSTKLVEKTIHFFDGEIYNIFKVRNGLGAKKFSMIEYDIDNIEMFKEQMKTLIYDLRKNSEDFDRVIDDIEISKFIIGHKDNTLIYAVCQYAPEDFMDTWFNVLKNSGYEITEISNNSFKISIDSWYLGEPMSISRIINRDF